MIRGFVERDVVRHEARGAARRDTWKRPRRASAARRPRKARGARRSRSRAGNAEEDERADRRREEPPRGRGRRRRPARAARRASAASTRCAAPSDPAADDASTSKVRRDRCQAQPRPGLDTGPPPIAAQVRSGRALVMYGRWSKFCGGGGEVVYHSRCPPARDRSRGARPCRRLDDVDDEQEQTDPMTPEPIGRDQVVVCQSRASSTCRPRRGMPRQPSRAAGRTSG